MPASDEHLTRRPRMSDEYLGQRLTPYPLPTKDSGLLRTVGDACTYLLTLAKARKLRVHWQHTSRLLLQEAGAAALTRQVHLSLFMDGKLDTTAAAGQGRRQPPAALGPHGDVRMRCPEATVGRCGTLGHSQHHTVIGDGVRRACAPGHQTKRPEHLQVPLSNPTTHSRGRLPKAKMLAQVRAPACWDELLALRWAKGVRNGPGDA
jgi:hypothetical protein